MTGYDLAASWLREHAPDWVIYRSEIRLEPGGCVGDPTIQVCRVVLGLHAKDQYGDVYGPMLEGTGETIFEAVYRAVGGEVSQ